MASPPLDWPGIPENAGPIRYQNPVLARLAEISKYISRFGDIESRKYQCFDLEITVLCQMLFGTLPIVHGRKSFDTQSVYISRKTKRVWRWPISLGTRLSDATSGQSGPEPGSETDWPAPNTFCFPTDICALRVKTLPALHNWQCTE